MELWNKSCGTDKMMEAVRRITGGAALRVMRAEHGESGWRVKFIALDDDYPIAAIERGLTRQFGETVRMVNLHYDFDTAARLICA